MCIDSHCHLNSPLFAGRVKEVLTRAEQAGLSAIVVPGWDEASSRLALKLADEFPVVRPAVGLHPWFTGQEDSGWLTTLLDDSRVVAIGEIGLDGAVAGNDPAQQEAVFRRQLQLAVERNLPVLLHCRRRWDRLLACLRDFHQVRGVVHAFSASPEVLADCLSLGLYISFAGMITRPNSMRAQQAAAIVPVDRLLIETDAPNMALAGLPASEVEPAHLRQVLDFIADLRGEDAQELRANTLQNAIQLGLL